MILDTKSLTVDTVKIVDAFAIRDFNNVDTEKFLAYEYEDKVARIFRKIKISANNNKDIVDLSNNEYRLLFRFFVIMWRRNNIHVDKAREFGNQIENVIKSVYGEEGIKDIKKPEFRDVSHNDLFQKMQDKISKPFYDKAIKETTDDDPTVQKTIKFYLPTIIYNKSTMHFSMHNTYATAQYMMLNGDIEISPDVLPISQVMPISSNLCLKLDLVDGNSEVDLTQEIFKIPIKILNDDNKIKKWIEEYATFNATHYIVDDTNVEVMKNIVERKQKLKAKIDENA